MTTSRTLCFLTSGLVSLVLATACASQAESFPGGGSQDASADRTIGNYCPPVGQGVGCTLPTGVCGVNYGLGCVSKGTTYGP